MSFEGKMSGPGRALDPISGYSREDALAFTTVSVYLYGGWPTPQGGEDQLHLPSSTLGFQTDLEHNSIFSRLDFIEARRRGGRLFLLHFPIGNMYV